MSFKDVYLGLDLSLTSPGFAVIALTEDNQPLILAATHIKTDAKKSHGHRLQQIGHSIDSLIKHYEPTQIVREKGFSRFAKVTQTLHKVVGVSDLVAHWHGHTIDEIPPTTVKKLLTGDGKAPKSEVERCVRKNLQIEKADYFENDDESDAAAVILAYLMSKKVI